MPDHKMGGKGHREESGEEEDGLTARRTKQRNSKGVTQLLPKKGIILSYLAECH